MKPRILFFIVIALIIVGGALYLSQTGSKKMNMSSSGSGTTATPTTSDTPPAASPVGINKVVISGYSFSPSTLKVKKGTTVTWTNNDSVKHTVTSDSGSGPASQLFGKGESYSYTFSTAGHFSYYCQPHPYMKGTVEVTE